MGPTHRDVFEKLELATGYLRDLHDSATEMLEYAMQHTHECYVPQADDDDDRPRDAAGNVWHPRWWELKKAIDSCNELSE